MKQRQYRNAIQDLAAAIHLDPSCWQAFYYRGCILQQVDPKRALRDFSVSGIVYFKGVYVVKQRNEHLPVITILYSAVVSCRKY